MSIFDKIDRRSPEEKKKANKELKKKWNEMLVAFKGVDDAGSSLIGGIFKLILGIIVVVIILAMLGSIV